MVDTDDTQRTTDAGQRHGYGITKLPTGELKITVQNWYFFTSSGLEIDDQDDKNQVKNLVLKSRNRRDQVMRTKSFWLMTRFRLSGPGHGQGR